MCYCLCVNLGMFVGRTVAALMSRRIEGSRRWARQVWTRGRRAEGGGWLEPYKWRRAASTSSMASLRVEIPVSRLTCRASATPDTPPCLMSHSMLRSWTSCVVFIVSLPESTNLERVAELLRADHGCFRLYNVMIS